MTIHVLQGERDFASDNRTLGRFNLANIPPVPRGLPQIEVEFNIDANGILQVTATEKTTSKSADIKITNSGGLSDEEMNRMKSEAEAHADEDRKRRELVDLKNRTEAFVSQTLKSLEEHGGAVTGGVRGKIESALSNVENKLKGDDIDALQAATRELESVCIELDKVRYEKARQEAGGASQPQSADGDDVIDAEYEVKDDG